VRPRKLILAALVVLTAAGCGERAEPLGHTAPLYPVTVRGAGEQAIALERRPRRVVALDPGPTELVARLGAGDRLVGVAAGVAPSRFYTEEVPSASVVVTATGRIDVDAVVAADPDLVVGTAETDEADLEAIARRTDAPVYVQPSRSLRDLEHAALELGLAIGAPVQGRRLARSLASEIDDVRARVEGRPPTRVFVDTGFFVSVPEHSLVADLVRTAGGESVVHGSSATDPLAPCKLLRMRPTVVVRLFDEYEPPARLQRRFARCRRRGPSPRIVVFPLADFWPGPRARAGLEDIARALHPNAFR
jgi:ABC-type Fe3+-hydroxamate transport system substrate-binding protein